jgi:hypothetical protein
MPYGRLPKSAPSRRLLSNDRCGFRDGPIQMSLLLLREFPAPVSGSCDGGRYQFADFPICQDFQGGFGCSAGGGDLSAKLGWTFILFIRFGRQQGGAFGGL